MFCAVALVATSSSFPQPKSGKALLDGSTFSVALAPRGKPAYATDTLTFAQGLFHSSECDQYRFQRGKYSAKRNGDVIEFETETRSAKEGVMGWKGIVSGDDITIDYVWDNRGQSRYKYTAKGKRRNDVQHKGTSSN
jgi:hypothetical protein